jgi:hypothetical protein
VIFRLHIRNLKHNANLEVDDDMDVAPEAVGESLDTSEDDILLKDEPSRGMFRNNAIDFR